MPKVIRTKKDRNNPGIRVIDGQRPDRTQPATVVPGKVEVKEVKESEIKDVGEVKIVENKLTEEVVKEAPTETEGKPVTKDDIKEVITKPKKRIVRRRRAKEEDDGKQVDTDN